MSQLGKPFWLHDLGLNDIHSFSPCWVGSVGSVSASRTVGCEFAFRPCHTKDLNKMVQTASLHGMHALGLEFGSAVQLSKGRVVCGTVYGEMHLKDLLGSFVRARVSYPGPRFLSSATWHSLPKKHYNGLNQTIPFRRIIVPCINGEITVKITYYN